MPWIAWMAVSLVAVGLTMFAAEARAEVEIVELPPPAGTDGPPVPWVVESDTAWQAGPPRFRLGGTDAITAVVSDFVDRVAADPRINTFFRGVDIPNLKRLISEQICSATGGPCTYSGRSMQVVHTGMNLTDDHFNALVQDLTAALDRANVPAREKGELLTALGGMKPDIVGH